MKVFISWSGDISHEVALILRDWLPLVIQAAKPFVSSEDIRSGYRWLHELSGTLEEYSTGIACLTPDNLDGRWINFEAGALSKSVKGSALMCLLIGLEPTDLRGPLSQFQLTAYDEDSVFKMVMDINDSVPETRAEREVIRQTFIKFFPDLRNELDPLVDQAKNTSEGKELEKVYVPEVLGEILAMVRSQQNILYNRLPPNDPLSVRISRETAREISANWMKIEKFLQSYDPAAIPEDVHNTAVKIGNLILELISDEGSKLIAGFEIVDIGKWKEHELPNAEWMAPERPQLRRIIVTDSTQEQASEEVEPNE